MIQERLKEVKYVDAIPSAGKSYVLKELIRDVLFLNKIIICLHTVNLIREYESDLKIPVHIIESDTSKSSVVHQLKTALSPDFHLRVILCTHQAFELYCQEAALNTSMQNALENVSVFVDEVPSGSFGSDIAISYESCINDHFPFIGLGWLEEVEEGVYYLKDEFRDNLVRFYEEEHCKSVSVKKIVWCLLQGNALLKIQDKKGFFFIAEAANPLILASQWAKLFTVMACGASSSELLYRAKVHLGYPVGKAAAEFQPDPSRAEFKATHLITVNYVIENKASMTKLASVYTEALNWIKRNFREGFLYSGNNDKTLKGEKIDFTSLADQELKSSGERISMAAYGLNYYAGYDVCGLSELELKGLGVQHTKAAYAGYAQCAYLGIVNDEPFHRKRWERYCEAMKWDFAALSDIRHLQNNAEKCLQVLARTVVRDHSNDKPVNFLVPDKITADYLKENYFPCSKIEFCGIELPKKQRKSREASETKGGRQLALIKSLKKEKKSLAEISKIIGLSLPSVKKYSAQLKSQVI